MEGLTFKQYSDLKKQLATVKQIKEVNGPFHNQVAELSLQSDLTAEKLAEKLADGRASTGITDVSRT